MNDSAKTLVVNVVNRHETSAVPCDVVLQSGEFTGNATIKEINADTVIAANTKAQEAVAITTKETQFTDSKLNHSFPAHSFTQILIPIK